MQVISGRVIRMVCRVHAIYLTTGAPTDGRRLARLMSVLYLMDLVQNPYFPMAV